jgi:hypothetical protein
MHAYWGPLGVEIRRLGGCKHDKPPDLTQRDGGTLEGARRTAQQAEQSAFPPARRPPPVRPPFGAGLAVAAAPPPELSIVPIQDRCTSCDGDCFMRCGWPGGFGCGPLWKSRMESRGFVVMPAPLIWCTGRESSPGEATRVSIDELIKVCPSFSPPRRRWVSGGYGGATLQDTGFSSGGTLRGGGYFRRRYDFPPSTGGTPSTGAGPEAPRPPAGPCGATPTLFCKTGPPGGYVCEEDRARALWGGQYKTATAPDTPGCYPF